MPTPEPPETHRGRGHPNGTATSAVLRDPIGSDDEPSRSFSVSARPRISTSICIAWCSIGVYRTAAGVPVFHAVRAPTAEELQVLLTRIIKRLMNWMHRDVQL